MKIEKVAIYNSYPAIIGIRNATKTWNKSDTKQIKFKTFGRMVSYNHADIGPKDHELISRLLLSSKVSGRPNHRKFMRQILVSFNLTAPKSFWSVFDSYKIGITTCDSNTMPVLKKVVKGDEQLDISHFECKSSNEKNALEALILKLNSEKDIDLVTTLLPQSFLLIKSWTGSYENLLNIYQDQRDNKFYQWQMVVETILKMPYMHDLIIPNSIDLVG